MSKVFLLFAIVLISCKTKTEFSSICNNSNLDPLREITEQEKGFALKIPERFSVVEPFSYFEFVAIDSTRYSEQLLTSLTVEMYDLKADQSFSDFYQDIDDRSSEQVVPDTIDFSSDFTTKFVVSQRESKISTVTMTQSGITLVTRTFYIKQDQTILTITLATNKSDAELEFCRLMGSVESIRKI